MNTNQVKTYLERAREHIGDRSKAESDYDDAVVAHLSAGKDIKSAIRAANQQYPDEALSPGADHWPHLAARYEYIMEHKAILKRLRIKE
jgi:hypothetical protein